MPNRSIERRLSALEQRHTPDLSAAYARAARVLETKLLAGPEPDEPIELSEEDLQQFIADTKAYLREQMAERNGYGK